MDSWSGPELLPGVPGPFLRHLGLLPKVVYVLLPVSTACKRHGQGRLVKLSKLFKSEVSDFTLKGTNLEGDLVPRSRGFWGWVGQAPSVDGPARPGVFVRSMAA